jgi:hypothetical protein
VIPTAASAPSSARPAAGRRWLPCALAALALLAGCTDTTVPDDLRFGQVGEVRVTIDAPRGADEPGSTPTGALQQIISWSSEGPWQSTERISYRGKLGDETVAVSRSDPGVLARSYSTLISLLNDEGPVKLFLGDQLSPLVNPTCTDSIFKVTYSRVTVQIIDAARNDSIAWTRCADGSLASLAPVERPAYTNQERLVQAAKLVRDFTVGPSFVGSYLGSLPFATLDRGEQSKSPLLQSRVIEDEPSWTSFWAQHTGSSSAPPEVDFTKEIVLVGAVGTRPEAGDSVEVRAVLPVGTRTQVSLWERRPGNFCTPAPRTHAPFHIVVTPFKGESGRALLPHPIEFFGVGVDQVPCG